MKKLTCLMLFLLAANIAFAQANKKGKYGGGPDDVPVADIIKGLSDDALMEVIQKQPFRFNPAAFHLHIFAQQPKGIW